MTPHRLLPTALLAALCLAGCAAPKSGSGSAVQAGHSAQELAMLEQIGRAHV